MLTSQETAHLFSEAGCTHLLPTRREEGPLLGLGRPRPRRWVWRVPFYSAASHPIFNPHNHPVKWTHFTDEETVPERSDHKPQSYSDQRQGWDSNPDPGARALPKVLPQPPVNPVSGGRKQPGCDRDLDPTPACHLSRGTPALCLRFLMCKMGVITLLSARS